MSRKDTLDEHKRRPDENLKIKCGKAHFREFDDVRYGVAVTVGDIIK
jgi:type III restriction enzyme